MQTLVYSDYSSEYSNMHTFGWGDMPYQGEYHFEETMRIPNPLSMLISLPESFFNTPWFHPSSAQHDHSHSITTTSSNNKNSHKRQRIRFAEHVQVRTYETILGYHPACTDGLALQCGWAYAETEYTPLSPCSANKKSVRDMRLDQMTRRQRLREVTGMSNLQLLQLANELLDVDASYSLACKRR